MAAPWDSETTAMHAEELRDRPEDVGRLDAMIARLMADNQELRAQIRHWQSEVGRLAATTEKRLAEMNAVNPAPNGKPY